MVEALTDMNVRSLNEPSVDFLILADRAEVVGGKLYVMGGGWDRQFVADIAQPVILSLAIGIIVPWNATNHQHSLEVTMEDFDGAPVSFRLEAAFTAGRSPMAAPGETQRVMLALAAAPQVFPKLGKYKIKAAINGTLMKELEFSVESKAPQILLAPGRPQSRP